MRNYHKNISLSSLSQKLFLLVILAFGCTAILLLASSSSTSAQNTSNFRAGNIIDDSVFFNDNTMTVNQIQQFMNSKVPNCDTHGQKQYRNTGLTRAEWAAQSSSRQNPPYTCLKEYTENIPGVSNGGSDLCTGSISSGTKSSARIIHEISKACGINPQVLLVMMQKEFSLVTDDWTWQIQYDRAMGYACPDSGPNYSANCDSSYYGFFNQVYNAAKAFKRYEANPTWYNYRANRNNNIQYNPNPDCGSSNVFIENQATANLYIYTPYQPNAATLAATPGQTVHCGAYGNLNFWRFFNNWFGSTSGTPFFRIEGRAPVYILGDNNNYYHVTSHETLAAYGYPSRIKQIATFADSYLSDKKYEGPLPRVARFEGASIYLLDRGDRHHFPSRAMYEDRYGYTIGGEARLPASARYYFRQSSTVREVIKEHDGAGIYSVENKKKRHITDMAAYNSGSPAYSSLPHVSLTKDYTSRLPDGLPIFAPDRIIRGGSSNNYYYWNGDNMQKVSASTLSQMGLKNHFTVNSSVISGFKQNENELNKLARSSSGNLYILDSRQKIRVPEGRLSDLGLEINDFAQTTDTLLKKVPTVTFTGIFRINNSARIYLAEDGERYAITSRKALSDRGYSIDQAININSSTASLIPDSGSVILALGTLYRHESGAQVYVVSDIGSSLRIPSRAIMEDYGFSFSSVISFSEEQVSNYSSDSSLQNLVVNLSGQIRLVQNGGERLRVTTEMASQDFYSIDKETLPVITTSVFVFSHFSDAGNLNEVIRERSDTKVYLVEGGEKRWVASRSALENAGYSMSDVTDVTGSLISSLPDGPNVN